MYEIARNCIFDAQKLLAADAPPRLHPGSLRRSSKPLVGWERGKSPLQTSPPQRLRRLASSSSATQVQSAPPKTSFWIHP